MVEEGEQKSDSERWRRAVDDAVSSLNAGQRDLFDAFTGCVLPGVSLSDLEAPVENHGEPPSCESRDFFLDAQGGTGTRAIHDLLRLGERKVIAVATSAVAAFLLDEGHIAHSTFKMPISCTAESTCKVAAGTGPS